jgi:hypothetical protein
MIATRHTLGSVAATNVMTDSDRRPHTEHKPLSTPIRVGGTSEAGERARGQFANTPPSIPQIPPKAGPQAVAFLNRA